jgi:hypothetical protein
LSTRPPPSDHPSRPPRIARALLEWMLPPADMGTVTGDLDEEYRRFVIGTFLTAPVALMLVALAALALPALRASRVDPVRTLREE